MKINKLTIYTSRLKEQLAFYKDELNFEVKNHNEKSFELITGYSVLRFERRETATPYHIAFHIPDRQEKEGLRWVEDQGAALKNNSEKIIDFSNWGAKSVYFYDEDKNIMELISRKDFSKPNSAFFSSESIVGIAEIGLATDNILEKFKKMNLGCRLKKFDGNFDDFCALGEASGLIITVDKNKKDWFPTQDKAHTSDFEMEFNHHSENFNMKFQENQLEISKI